MCEGGKRGKKIDKKNFVRSLTEDTGESASKIAKTSASGERGRSSRSARPGE